MAEDLSMFGVSNAPAAAVATPAAPSTGDDLSMFGISTPAAPKQESNFLQHPVDSTVNYVSGWGGAIHDAVKKLWNTPNDNPIKADLQTGAALATGLTAPIAAAASYMPHTDNEGGTVEDSNADTRSYTQRKSDYSYNPTDPAAQAKVQLIGSVLKPIPDALKSVASVFTSNTEHQEMIADALQYAIPGLKESIKIGGAGDLAKAPSIASHPAVVAANDLGTKYNIPLTKGQQVAQAATDLPASDTATAKALQVPYQLETKSATQTTKVGQQYSNHFDTQQNTLASHVQGVADELRKAGDTDSADLVENAIVEKQPGVNAVDGNKLQKAIDKSSIADPTLAAKLNDLNDLSGIIDKPAKGGAIADPGIVRKIVDKFGVYAGAGAGAVIGAKLGHPVIGAEIGAGLGSRAVTKFFSSTPTAGPLNVSTLSMGDVSALAKKAGVSPDVMAKQLAQRAPAAPAAAPVTTAGVSPSVAPMPARTMPTVDFQQTPSAPGAAPAAPTTDFTSTPSSGFTSLTKDHGVRTRDVGTQVLADHTDLDALIRGGLVNDPYNLGGVYRKFGGN